MIDFPILVIITQAQKQDMGVRGACSQPNRGVARISHLPTARSAHLRQDFDRSVYLFDRS